MNITRLADITILKPLSLNQEATERKVYMKFSFYKPKYKEMATFITKNFITMFQVPLPSFWSDTLSKSWGTLRNEKDAIEFCNHAVHAGFSLNKTESMLKIRGYDRSTTWVKEILNKENLKIWEERKLKQPKPKEEENAIEQPRTKKVKPLSPKEREVYELKQLGFDTLLIAEKSHLTKGSVGVYLSTIKKKGWL